ncbi:MAG: hypothetical protein RE468_11945 [Acidithiobacillus caldus]|uniref:Uncharacterized protein n=1 Tax=Acidithiobacillus caldus TaxID=33059 RepID=A0A1E7YRW7_9PROT|nr:hypothetical protein [Acidithiobacillus caldus]OFC40835.1 hypothetical protein BAE30_16325 [Acidithiobacillus caldus]WMT46590.1 MAG: hypothetical protein RE468_11945 [Acidithiobacillus caldus]
MNKEQSKHLAATFQAVALAELGYFGYQAMSADRWWIFCWSMGVFLWLEFGAFWTLQGVDDGR